MAGLEDIIPKHERLDTVIACERDALEASFDGAVHENGNISLDAELHYLADDDRAIRFANAFGGLLRQEGYGLRQAQRLAYRSTMFAYQTIATLRGAMPEQVRATYLNEIGVSGAELPKAIRRDVAAYLEARPVIRAYIEQHVIDIDTSGRHAEYVILSAGFTFMLIEKRDAEAYIQADIENLHVDDIDWQGDELGNEP